MLLQREDEQDSNRVLKQMHQREATSTERCTDEEICCTT